MDAQQRLLLETCFEALQAARPRDLSSMALQYLNEFQASSEYQLILQLCLHIPRSHISPLLL